MLRTMRLFFRDVFSREAMHITSFSAGRCIGSGVGRLQLLASSTRLEVRKKTSCDMRLEIQRRHMEGAKNAVRGCCHLEEDLLKQQQSAVVRLLRLP